MIFLIYLIVWSLLVAFQGFWGWSKIESNLKVHLMFLLSCIYFLGIFGGYAYFHQNLG